MMDYTPRMALKVEMQAVEERLGVSGRGNSSTGQTPVSIGIRNVLPQVSEVCTATMQQLRTGYAASRAMVRPVG